MASKRLVLIFPPHLIEEPVTYRLIKRYDVKVNILRANIVPRDYGRLVVELDGTKEAIEEATAYLTEVGVTVQPLAKDVCWHEDRCVECTACTAVCPTGALAVDRPDMRIVCEHDKCIACELCVSVCPYQAIEILL
jgi:ferredoxin